MKAYHLVGQQGPASLAMVDLPDPAPGPGQVLVRVHANALNYRDLMISDGRYGSVSLPLVPLSDGAGEVVACGEGVTRWRPGDRVAGTFFQGWGDGAYRREIAATALGGALPGMLAEQVVLPETGLVSIPPHLDFIHASTLPCAGVTAWHALVESGQVKAGQTVLLLGTGGVSLFALQIAKMHGARTLITSGSDQKLERALSLGADAAISYKRNPDWDEEVFRLTDRRGVDHVVEVGGQGTFSKSLRSLAPHGKVHVVGGVSGFSSEISLRDILGRLAVVQGVFVGSRRMFESLNCAVALHRLQPVVDRVFGWTEAALAYRYLQSGAHFGKVVIARNHQPGSR